MPVLARAWQMLLKGHDEVKSSARPHAAADMVLVRLAYAADLPTPGDLMRRLGDSSGEAEGAPRAMPNKQAPREPAPAMRQDAPPPATEPSPVDETEDPAPPLQPSLANPKSFEEVVALAEEKRDLKLKHALSEQVRLVRFRPGHLELNPLGTAPKELGQDLMRKLKAWTGRVWIVALSGERRRSTLGRAAPRARSARDRAHSRSPRRQASAATFPRRAHRRGAGDRERGAPAPRPRSTTGPRLSSRRTGPTHEEFCRHDEAGPGAADPHGRDAGGDGARPRRGTVRRRSCGADAERQGRVGRGEDRRLSGASPRRSRSSKTSSSPPMPTPRPRSRGCCRRRCRA